MGYCGTADVQARIARSVWDSGAASPSPTLAEVAGWIEEVSAWIDATLAWRYRVPVTDATDLLRVRRPCAALVGAMVLEQLATAGGDLGDDAGRLVGEGLAALVYHPGGVGTSVPGGSSLVIGKETSGMGRNMLVLPNTALAETGEAALGQPLSSFTDPEAEGSVPRLFGAGREW